MPGNANIIIGMVVIVLVMGTVFALVWWRLADVIYPGVDEKTGQRIGRRKRRREGAAPGAKVVTGFEERPRDSGGE